jgi:formate dehydrogenase accessory protein FdhE
MTPFQAASSVYDQRLRRAEYLAKTHLFAAEILTFFQPIATFQKSLHASLAGKVRARTGAPFALRDTIDVSLVVPDFRAFLSVVEGNAPAPLADAARQLMLEPAESWVELLAEYCRCGGRGNQEVAVFAQFFPRAFLQPYVEFLAEPLAKPALLSTTSVCPFCGAQPALGVIRREGDGGKRFLLCSFCAQEWEFRRILCPTCGEESEEKLPVYVAEQLPHIRVEACDSCKFCLRTIDLTKDGNAVPLVDDLAALPLSLWAQEHGYARREENLLGT